MKRTCRRKKMRMKEKRKWYLIPMNMIGQSLMEYQRNWLRFSIK